MFSRIRKRLTYTNIAMTLAFVFATTGGAYAASKVLITSTKQIKPSVLKQLKGKAGAQGPAGARGPTGTAGAQGSAGANGKDGVLGKDGVSVTSGTESAGVNCKAGGSKFVSVSGTTYACNGANGQTGFTSTLPSGKTETGTWAFGPITTAATGEAPFVYVPLASFAIPLAAPLTNVSGCGETGKPACQVHYINKLGEEVLGSFSEPKTTSPGPECGGSAAAPNAEPGNLCIYAAREEATTTAAQSILSPASEEEAGASIAGAVGFFHIGGNANGRGTWAVTAP